MIVVMVLQSFQYCVLFMVFQNAFNIVYLLLHLWVQSGLTSILFRPSISFFGLLNLLDQLCIGERLILIFFIILAIFAFGVFIDWIVLLLVANKHLPLAIHSTYY